ncbi:metalloprotease TIKI1 [Coregonus clupeaformis]|uniref:metalloprotease TIKI1 n=1 Tax=Coregonus clupeaformis TaxID=59861 RepID=UPI001E1C43A1|nr:metalloprotease TIKI1 [Coregonus clupeaformis]
MKRTPPPSFFPESSLFLSAPLLSTQLAAWTGTVIFALNQTLLQQESVIFALNQTLLQQESVRAGSLQVPYTTEDLIKHYNCGDLNSIIFNHDTSQVPNFNNVTLRPSEQITAQEIDSYFRQELIYKRNERMGNRVKALMEESPDNSFFFAFGAGHFLGNNTVIDVLRSQGYEVEHTPAGQPINSRSKSAPDQAGQSLGQVLDESPYLEPFLHELHDEEQQRPLEDSPLPHMLLPHHSQSLELMDKMDRKLKKKRRNKQKKHQRNRQFNDLWVRIEESTTVESPPPPLVRIVNGYITIRPHHHDHERGHAHGRANYNWLLSDSSASTPWSFLWLLFTVLGHIWFLY